MSNNAKDTRFVERVSLKPHGTPTGPSHTHGASLGWSHLAPCAASATSESQLPGDSLLLEQKDSDIRDFLLVLLQLVVGRRAKGEKLLLGGLEGMGE